MTESGSPGPPPPILTPPSSSSRRLSSPSCSPQHVLPLCAAATTVTSPLSHPFSPPPVVCREVGGGVRKSRVCGRDDHRLGGVCEDKSERGEDRGERGGVLVGGTVGCVAGKQGGLLKDDSRSGGGEKRKRRSVCFDMSQNEILAFSQRQPSLEIKSSLCQARS
eukprot:GHVQ01006697.1.p1 GENE.GHVQ01006697.1~~GHVQ01006697.1.p1  ORF type:complete len:172 (-),score=47.77 GHVQ01006697.1:131-622(-)